MDNQSNRSTEGGDQGSAPEGSGYSTPGQDTILRSNSEAVPSPGKSSEERLTVPKSTIQSIGEQSGDANPALAETEGFERGQVSTADLLSARETAEEQRPRAAGNTQPYEDQPQATADEFEVKDAGRPNWPDDRQQEPIEYMDAPRADMPLLSGNVEGFEEPHIKGRQDATMDRDGTQASKGESRSGLPAVGLSAEEDEYERREMDAPSEPSELDRIAPGMLNVPPEDDNG